jgi:hypothetical protein
MPVGRRLLPVPGVAPWLPGPGAYWRAVVPSPPDDPCRAVGCPGGPVAVRGGGLWIGRPSVASGLACSISRDAVPCPVVRRRPCPVAPVTGSPRPPAWLRARDPGPAGSRGCRPPAGWTGWTAGGVPACLSSVPACLPSIRAGPPGSVRGMVPGSADPSKKKVEKTFVTPLRGPRRSTHLDDMRSL